MTDPAASDDLYRRITRRLIPPLFCGWVVAYIDNLNVGFAQLQMRQDIGLSDAVFGFGATLALVGSILFQLPSNLWMQRIGASRTMARVLLAWFCVSLGMAAVETPNHYLMVRLITGIATAGYWTGILYYLTLWYPEQKRAQILSLFLLAPVVAAIIVGPISGTILATAHGLLGMEGWQWMFLLESLPALGVALWLIRALPDGPKQARFLTAAEQTAVIAAVARPSSDAPDPPWQKSLLNYRVLILGLVNAVASFAIFLINFFGPSLISDLGSGNVATTGFLSAIPYCVGGVVMLIWSRRSDRMGERRWHYLSAILLAALGFCLLARAPNIYVGMLGMTFAISGLLASIPVFWSIPSAFLPTSAAAAGLAVVNMLGDTGGALAPTVMGAIRTYHGDVGAALIALAVFLVLSAALIFMVGEERLQTQAHR